MSDPLEETLATHKHTGCSLGTLAQLVLSLCVSQAWHEKKMERRKKTSPLIFLESQKGEKGWIKFLQLGTAEQNIDQKVQTFLPGAVFGPMCAVPE